MSRKTTAPVVPEPGHRELGVDLRRAVDDGDRDVLRRADRLDRADAGHGQLGRRVAGGDDEHLVQRAEAGAGAEAEAAEAEAEAEAEVAAEAEEAEAEAEAAVAAEAEAAEAEAEAEAERRPVA